MATDNGSYATGFLCLRYGMDGKSCLAAGFGTVDFGDRNMGLQARLMSQAMRKLTGAISRTNTSACSPLSGWDMSRLFMSTPRLWA